MIKPAFIRNRMVDVSVATSGYCQARCESCVWPYMDKFGNVMSGNDFAVLIQRLFGYQIGEFCFNVINEPFIDKGILSKIASLAGKDVNVKRIFFSSNWLIPKLQDLAAMMNILEELGAKDGLNSISLNATVSGIDEASYDRLQAGRDLRGTVAPYRKLDFEQAVGNVCSLIMLLRESRRSEKIVFNVKAYGTGITSAEMKKFWLRRLGVSDLAELPFVRIALNGGYTTFARQDEPSIGVRGSCRTGWLDNRLVIGPAGDVGLCCEDGLRQVIVGNLLQSSLDELVEGELFQEQLRILLGAADAPSSHPCLRCQHFEYAMPSLREGVSARK